MAASNALWGYLLRKDLPEQESVSKIPPLAPVDKTGTSIRMLVHDTQANLEKFSGRVDGLLSRVDDCKSQVVNATNLLEAERDRLLAEMLDMANRCQSELKSHVGTPAQVQALDVLQISQLSTEKSVQALEKRIDALQGMFQAHTDVLKSIQDQQNAILNGILPLFPLVQSVPRQIDELNLNLTNAIPNAVSNLTNSLDDIKTAFKSFESMHAQQMHTPRLATVTASRPPSKRPGSAVQDSSDIADRVDASPSPYREHRADSRSPKRSRLDAELRSAAPPQLRSQLTPKSFRPQVADVSAPILHRNPSLVSLPPGALPSPARQMALETVKRPFDDLLPASEPSKVEILGSNVRLHEECKVSQTYARDSPLPGITHREGPPASTLPALATNGRHFDTTGNSVSNPIVLGSPGPSVVDATRKSVKIEDSMQKLTGTFSITSSPLSSVPSQPQSHPPSMAQSGASAPVPREQSRLQSHEVEILTRHQPRQMHFTALSSQLSNLPVSSNPCTSTSPSKSMSLRDRRAQMSVLGRTRTRRIIPLLPSSDEEF